MKTLYQSTILFFLVTLAWVSCASAKKPQNSNLSYLYNSKSVIPKVDIRLHHLNEDSSAIYLHIDPEQIVFDPSNEANPKGEAQLLTYYQLYTYDEDNTTLVDTLAKLFTIPQTTDQMPITLRTYMPMAAGKRYYLQVYVSDQISRKIFKNQLTIFKDNAFGEQNFLPINPKTGLVYFDKYVKQGESIALIYRNTEQSSYRVSYYKPSSQLALPPFVTDKKRTFPTEPDSVFIARGPFTPKKTGLYYFQANAEKEGGFPVVCVESSYPKLTSAKDLAVTLRFITRNEEYAKINRDRQPKAVKKAIDEFWLQRAGSPERGRVLIKAFYGRVQRSNEYFTTYKSGWKTDRGLVYIIYGEPDEVYKDPYSEQWVYAEQGNEEKLTFLFSQKPNSVSQQNFELQRDPYYTDSWHMAVYKWRKGLVGRKK